MLPFSFPSDWWWPCCVCVYLEIFFSSATRNRYTTYCYQQRWKLCRNKYCSYFRSSSQETVLILLHVKWTVSGKSAYVRGRVLLFVLTLEVFRFLLEGFCTSRVLERTEKNERTEQNNAIWCSIAPQQIRFFLLLPKKNTSLLCPDSCHSQSSKASSGQNCLCDEKWRD